MINKYFLHDLFVLTKSIIKNNSLYNKAFELNHAYLYMDNRTKHMHLNHNGTTIILIGFILDIQDSSRNSESILLDLVEKHSQNLDAFHDYLNFLNGRYTLIVSNNQDTTLYTDATSMKPIFYYGDWLFASHEIFIKDTLKNNNGLELKTRKHSMKYFLDYTNTIGIYRFNPNLYFSFKGQKFHRFFPRQDFIPRTLDEVIDNTVKYYEPQLEWLDRHYETISLSLTGGFDSKLSLALVKPLIHKVETFTYMYRFKEEDNYNTLDKIKRIYYKDKVIVDNLVYNFNLNHKYFYLTDYNPPQEYLEILETHMSSRHSFNLSYLTSKEFDRSSVHLKSTLFELAKLPHINVDDGATDGSWVLKNIKHWAPKVLKNNNASLIKHFKAYYERNLTSEILDYNYNLPLMLYWEFRMANWHGNLTQETDFIIDTFIFINSRYLLDQLTSLSSEDREDKKYLKKIVTGHWPALNYFVANSFDTLEDKK